MVQSARHVIHERDEHGAPYAVEVVDAQRWDSAFLEPPPVELADVRVVRLAGGAPPADLPRWLAVQVPGRRVADPTARYAAAAPAGPDAETPAVGRALWPWSPYYREPGAGLTEFLAAGAAALRHPDPAPTETRRQLELIADFTRGREPPLAQLATLRAEALERWLRYSFGQPDRFAEALLLERIRDEAPDEVSEVHDALRFLAEAVVPDDAPEHAELAVDRRVLREQASPWRYFDGVPFAGPLAAMQAWRRRYRLAYEAHYRAMTRRAAELREQLELTSAAAASLERLDGIRALGEPVGGDALESYAGAVAALDALPAEPEPREARTAGVTLGRAPAMFAQATAAGEAIGRALELQRRRLASRAVRIVLERQGVPALDRLLQAITASDVDGIERVLDERLAAHIDRLLADAAESPFSQLAARHPAVTAATLDQAVASFRELLEESIAAADDGRAVLREDLATPAA